MDKNVQGPTFVSISLLGDSACGDVGSCSRSCGRGSPLHLGIVSGHPCPLPLLAATALALVDREEKSDNNTRSVKLENSS